jgi:AcrR family transcriptional regulator
MKTQTEREVRARRAIMDAASGLLSKDSGTSLAQVATQAGMGRTTVHRYFATREALLTALAVDAIDRLETAVTACHLDEGPVPQVLRRVAEALVPMSHEFRFLQVGPQVWDLPELNDRWYSLADRIEQVVERGRREGDLRLDIPTAWLTDLFGAALWCAGDSIADGRLARRDAPSLIVEVLLRGAGSPS